VLTLRRREKSIFCRKSKPGRSARSQSLYRLRYLIPPSIFNIQWELISHSATKPNRLMLYTESMSVYRENCMKHTNTRGQNAEFIFIIIIGAGQETRMNGFNPWWVLACCKNSLEQSRCSRIKGFSVLKVGGTCRTVGLQRVKDAKDIFPARDSCNPPPPPHTHTKITFYRFLVGDKDRRMKESYKHRFIMHLSY
jgi:hypothetical protein